MATMISKQHIFAAIGSPKVLEAPAHMARGVRPSSVRSSACKDASNRLPCCVVHLHLALIYCTRMVPGLPSVARPKPATLHLATAGVVTPRTARSPWTTPSAWSDCTAHNFLAHVHEVLTAGALGRASAVVPRRGAAAGQAAEEISPDCPDLTESIPTPINSFS